MRVSPFAMQLAAASLLLATPLFAASYHLTFDDEFNSYNSSRWQTADFYGMRNNGGDFQGQWFCDPTYSPSGYTAYNPFVASGSGTLNIRAQPTNGTSYYSGGLSGSTAQPYLSGQLTTAHKFTQRYGYYELRAKLPPGKGLWSRFWFLTDDGAWPGEYDCFEVLGRENPSPVHQTTHFRNTNTSHGIDGFTYAGTNATDGNFHTYGFLWEPKTVTWYVDGVATLKQDNRIDKPMYILLDLTVGNDPLTTWPGSPDGTTPWPANMEMDYFRVYSADPSLPSVTPDSGYSASTIPDGSTAEVTPTTAQLPAGWTAGDIVSPAAYLGSTTWNTNTGEWMLKGTSYANGNQYQFASTSLSSDGAVIATVGSVAALNANTVNSGVMIRESSSQSSRQIDLLYTTAVNDPTTINGLKLLTRTNTSGSVTSLTISNVSAPVTLRLLRTATNTYTAAYSTNAGLNWITVGTAQTNTMGNTVLAGIALGADTGQLELARAIFNNVTVGQFAPVLTPATNTVVTGQTIGFTASLINQSTGSNASTGTITWSVASGGGTIDSNGVYTASAMMGTGTATITAVFGTNFVSSTIAVVLPSPWLVPSLVQTPPSDAGFTSGVWTVAGGGAGISTNGSQDWFRFVSSAMSGNGTNTVMVNSLGGLQAGLVIRDLINVGDAYPDAGACYAGIWSTATGLQWATRETANGNAASRAQLTTAAMPIWLRLTRSGASTNIFTAYYSTNGNTWTQLGSPRTFAMSAPALVGLAVASGSAMTTTTNTFSNLNFSASTNACLFSLVVSPGTYTPTFASNVLTYVATNYLPNNQVTVTVTNADLTATNILIYNGSSQGTLASGSPSSLLTMTQGTANVVKVLVTAQDGLTTNLYTVNVTLQPSQTQPYLTNSVSGGTNLVLNWPSDHTGWRLLVQTNNLQNGVSSNTNDWATATNSSNTNQVFVPIVITNRSGFYRMVYP